MSKKILEQPAHDVLYAAYRQYAEHMPSAPAILAPGRPHLTWFECLKAIDSIVEQLRSLKVEPGDRVATVLPDGPEMALAFLALTASFTHVPLNPQGRYKELEQSLRRVDAQVLLVPSGCQGAALLAAKHLELELIEVRPIMSKGAGTFTLHRLAPGKARERRAALNEAALVLFTSGTTSQPSIVPLTESNLYASARHIRDSFELTQHDRRLNVMPLFHVQGLIGGILAPLQAGGSVVCTPGFDPDCFLDWLEIFQPTWYSAVPTIHSQILAKVRKRDCVVRGTSLRLIRNGSFPLKPSTLSELEEVFGVPVIEAYGMTETASQISCNPLPPRVRKSGSAGLPAGSEVAIFDLDGNPLKIGEIGEIVVRGPNVIKRYEDDDSHQSRFWRDWFRTGDLGRFDEEGYLYVEGRLKNIINRGGEKILPGEVERILAQHSGVLEAVVFPVPDARLGEEVAAAVIPRKGVHLDGHMLASFLSSQLSAYKIPRRFLFLSDLPRGITGKVSRQALATQLGLHQSDREPKRVLPLKEKVESELKTIWCRLLRLDKQPSVKEDFFDLGGSSLLLLQLVDQVERIFGQRISVGEIFPQVTIEAISNALNNQSNEDTFKRIVPMQVGKKQPNLFLVHPAGGSVLCYTPLVRHLKVEQSVYGVQAPGFEGNPEEPIRVELLATTYIELIQNVQPTGPYALAGWSLGGIICYEMARQLIQKGERIATLAMIDSLCPLNCFQRVHEQFLSAVVAVLDRLDLSETASSDAADEMWSRLAQKFDGGFWELIGYSTREHQREIVLSAIRKLGMFPFEEDPDDLRMRRILRALRAGYHAAKSYRPQGSVQSLLFFRAGDLPEGCNDPTLGWREFVEGEIRVVTLNGNHFNVLNDNFVSSIAKELHLSLDANVEAQKS